MTAFPEHITIRPVSGITEPCDDRLTEVIARHGAYSALLEHNGDEWTWGIYHGADYDDGREIAYGRTETEDAPREDAIALMLDDLKRVLADSPDDPGEPMDDADRAYLRARTNGWAD